MQEEKFNNSWKIELDALDSLPGEVWNKEAAWGKLEQRLESKRSNRKIFWYWAAAASLLLIISTQWMKETDKADPVVKRTTDKANNRQEAIKGNQKIPHIIPTAKEQPSIAVTKKEKSRSVVTSAIPTSNQSVPIDSAVAINDLIEEAPAVMPDTIETAVVETPVTKPLRVVHINEIGKPVEEKTKLAQVRRLGSGGLNGNTFTNDYTPDDNILKIKLSPNN